MKKYLYIIACGALLLSGCAKEVLVAPDFDSKAVFKVSIQQDTRTVLGELAGGRRPIYWSNGDKININGFESEALADVEEGQTAAQFVFSPAPDAPYSIVYPSSIYASEGKVVLPSTASVMPMCGYTTDTNKMNLKVFTGAAKITITPGSDDGIISYVQIEAAGQQLSGEFALDCKTGELTSATGELPAVNSTVRKYVRKAVTAEPVEVFIPVPAGTYTSLTVKVVDVDGHYLSQATTSAKTFTAGEIKAFPAIAFNPTGTLVDVEIPTAAKWNEFATAYNEGTVGDGFVSITADLDFSGIDVVTLGSYRGGKYFGGTIDGGKHVIKNLKSTKPLIGSINTYGTLKDLTIDESCSYTVPYGAEEPEYGYFAPFVLYLKGQMSGCVNKANIKLDLYRETNNTTELNIGGLIARIKEGTATDCVNYGSFTLENTYKSDGNTYVGGIVGYISNPEGTVEKCANHGVLLNHTCWSREVYLGGIAGRSHGTLKDCTNDAQINSDINERPSGDACKHIFSGGICARQEGGSITGCQNSGNLINGTKVKLQYFGGIAGNVAATVTNRDNTNSGNITSTGAVRVPMYGGLYGSVTADNVFEFSGKPFTGIIQLNEIESGDNSYGYVGGLVGIARNSITLRGVGAPVEVPDSITFGPTANKPWRLSLGGVIGAAGEIWGALKDTLDLGDGGEPYINSYEQVNEESVVEISNFHTTGSVRMPKGSGIKPGTRLGSFGGIIGGMLCGGTIENCINDADVVYGEDLTTSNSNGYPMHIGGIVGRMDGGDGKASVIRNCTNNGIVYNRLYNNNSYNIRGHRGSLATGGIVGSFGYKNLSKATLTVENCHNTGSIYGYRGAAGGILGYANHTTVKDCDFIGSKISRGAPTGGIVGAGENSAVEGCTVKLSTGLTATAGGSCIADCGGIFGVANNCSVDGSRFFGKVTGAGAIGGILGNNDAACTIGKKTISLYGGFVGDNEIDDMFYIMYYAGHSELIDVDIVEGIGYWDGTL